jgi:DNA-binding response OmpR family regulator
MRILVVDDEPLVAHTVSLIFRKKGFEVMTVHSAQDALVSALATPPDLVLCDIDMPGRNGIDLITDLDRELPNCPILVLTGFYSGLPDIDAHVRTLRQSVRVLTKPCPPLELLREANSLLTV